MVLEQLLLLLLPVSALLRCAACPPSLAAACRCILHGEAVRIAQLEAENQALHR